MTRAANPLPPAGAARRVPSRRPLSFRRVFLGVLIAHLLVILGIAFFRLPARKAAGTPGDPQPIAMFTPVSPAAAAPAPAPQPPTPPVPTPPTPPQPEPPQPTPPPEPAPEPEPTPAAPEAPSQIVLPPTPPTPAPPKPETPKAETPKPTPAPTPPKPAPAAPAPAKPEKHVPKVNLTEVSRDGGPAPAKAPAHTAANATGDGSGPALKASDIARQLGGAGGTPGPKIAIPGPVGDGGENGGAEYYALIQRAMYAAWDQPTELAGRHLVARIEVHIARDGTITGCSLAATSGNPAFDASSLAAARRVAKLSKPRPDDVPEAVAINFKLAD